MAKRTAAVKAPQTPQVIDVGETAPTSEIELTVRSAGAMVGELMLKVGAFFRKAETLEERALATLEEAQRFKLKPPTTADEDLALQKFIVRTGVENKEIVEHWKITTAISKFHRTMTGKRGIAEKATDDANRIANDLHAAYVREEKRRVAAEEERLRREAEALEEQRRARELEALEAEAIRREEQAVDLTERERTFVDLYLVRGDGKLAAAGAGYKEPAKNAARLLTLPKIQAAIQAKKAAAAVRQQAEALKREPLLVEPAQEVKTNVVKLPGTTERGTHAGELLDEQLLIDAILSGRYGIPPRILKIDTSALNQEARDLKEQINKWPGVRYKFTPRMF